MERMTFGWHTAVVGDRLDFWSTSPELALLFLIEICDACPSLLRLHLCLSLKICSLSKVQGPWDTAATAQPRDKRVPWGSQGDSKEASDCRQRISIELLPLGTQLLASFMDPLCNTVFLP